MNDCAHAARHLKQLLSSAALLGTLLLSSACGRTGPTQARDVITFGAALSLTGKTATEGGQVRDGYDFYVTQINRRGGIKAGGRSYKVVIRYYDDQSDENTSARLYERLITEDGIKLLLGPYSSANTFSASAVAEKHQVPMIAAHAGASAIYERRFRYLFATLNTQDQYTQNMIKMAAESTPRAQRVALINENALFPQAGIDGAAAQAKAAGLDVVYKEAYPTGTKDFSSMLAAVKSRKPDVLLAGGYTGDMIVLVRQCAEQGLHFKMIGILLGPTLPGFVASLGSKAECLLEPVQWSPNMTWKDEIFGWTAAEFASVYQQEMGYAPDYHPPQSAAALEVYQRAIERAGTTDPQKVRDAIAGTDMVTFYGPIKFDEKGRNIAKSMAVVQIQHGKPVVVYPADRAQSKFIYPIPGR